MFAVSAAGGQSPPPATAEAWQKLGLERHLENKFTEAISAFTHALQRNPALWTSHLFLGIGRYRTNAFALAVESLARADKLGPADGPGRDEIDFWLGAARIAAGQPLPGLRSLERLLARNPAHADALQLAAETYGGVSTRLWNELAEHHFESAAGQHVHALVLESEGDTVNALAAYRRSRTLNARRAGPAGAIGRLLLAEKQPEAALQELRAELALRPADGEAALRAGVALIQLGRLAEAAEYLASAMRLLPENPEPAVALAQVRLGLGQPVRAVEAAAAAVKAAPRLAAAHELLVAALQAVGNQAALAAEESRWRAAFGPHLR